MATPSGAPPAPTTNSKTTTPEQKRLFILLGVGGVLALLVGGRFVLGAMGGSSTETASTDAVATNAAPVASVPDESGAPNPGAAAPGSPAGVPASATGAAGTTPAQLLPLARYRRDPFQPFFIFPTPTPVPPPRPTPRPTPTPAPPVEIPLPESVGVPSPDGSFGGANGGGGNGGSFGNGLGGGGLGGGASAGSGVPGFGGSFGSGSQPLILPGVVIPRLNARNAAPTDAFPPPRSASGGGGGVPSPSFDKRLSGVVIGNGVRAILEVNSGGAPKSYVVQPGDVVEGVTVLSISRFNEGGDQVTRMLVRENGGERYIDLKPGTPRAQGAAGGQGFPGAPGIPGGPRFGRPDEG